MARISKTGVAALLVALVVGWSIWPANASRLILSFQDQAESALVEVASGPLGEPTLTLNGRSVFSPDAVSLYGYVSTVGGLGDADLFTEASQSEQTARFTFAAELAVASSTDRADVTISAAAGDLRIYFNEAAGSNWTDPASFSSGQLVGEYSFELRDTLHRQAPGVGLAVATGQLVQSASEEFAIGEERIQFGHPGLEQRLRYVGALVPGSQAGESYAVGFTGGVTVTGRESIVVILGDPDAATPATPAAGANLCAQLEPWLSGTTERLAQARAIEAATPANGALESLDAAALRQAASEVNSLVTAQRETAVPGEAAATNRLTVTALSTYARGLQTVADAAEAQDADLLAQGQTALRDGGSLLARAAEAVNAVAPECAAGVA